MDKNFFIKEINKLTGLRESRKLLSEYVIENPECYDFLFELINDEKFKKKERASWIIEFVSLEKIDWLIKAKNMFISSIPFIKNDSVIRSFAKLASILSEYHLKTSTIFNKGDIQILIDNAFDWLIHPDLNTAPKVHAMQTLYHLHEHENWIAEELVLILEQNFPSESPGYQSRARKILKQLKKTL